jgi:hypothetical protein
MMAQSEIDETSRGRFMQAVQTELEKFERRENEFQKSEREERAARLAVLVKAGGGVLPH